MESLGQKCGVGEIENRFPTEEVFIDREGLQTEPADN